jgi:hypothetical protein
MAAPISHNNRTMIFVAAGAIVVLLILLFALGGRHNNGQPSAPSGPGNPMQTDQGR